MWGSNLTKTHQNLGVLDEKAYFRINAHDWTKFQLCNIRTVR